MSDDRHDFLLPASDELRQVAEIHNRLVELQLLIPASGVGTYGPLMEAFSAAIAESSALLFKLIDEGAS